MGRYLTYNQTEENNEEEKQADEENEAGSIEGSKYDQGYGVPVPIVPDKAKRIYVDLLDPLS